LGRTLEDGDRQVVLLHLAVLLQPYLLGKQMKFGNDLRLQVTEVETGLAIGTLAAVTAAVAPALLPVGLPALPVAASALPARPLIAGGPCPLAVGVRIVVVRVTASGGLRLVASFDAAVTRLGGALPRAIAIV